MTGQGCAAVVGTDQEVVRTMVLRSAGACTGGRVVVVSARFKGLDSVAELLRRGRTSAPAAEIEPILVELAAARTEGGPLFIVVHDADFACAGALDRLRIATESFSDESVQIRLVLCGGAFLLHLLELPQLRGLSTRVTSLIRLQS